MSEELYSQEVVQNVDKLDYGTPRHSGRYPWGSGKNPQRSKNWLQRAEELEKQGMPQADIAKAMGLKSSYDYRQMKAIMREDKRMNDIREVRKLKDKDYSVQAISEKTGLSWSTVNKYLNNTDSIKNSKLRTVANALTEQLEQKPYLDIGEGVERQLNISDTMLQTACAMLESEGGYRTFLYRVPQASNPNNKTVVKVLAAEEPGVEYLDQKNDIWNNHRFEIASPDGVKFEDYGSVVRKIEPIQNIDSKRILIRYNEEGGIDKDGVIEIRPGVEDLSLGGRRYAQVRIGVDGDKYLKGMAVYATDRTDMPDGIDIVFNTNKHEGTPLEKVLKPQVRDASGNIDPTNPFGSSFDQWSYDGSDGKKHISPVNIVNDDESWDKWRDSLSSQFLSKQPIALAQRQLNLAYLEKQQEFNDILAIENATLRRQKLADFAEGCDSDAVHLKAAALPRQSTNAIIPVNSLKDDEVYAPGYSQGEEVILVRYPHAGTFEIPKLRVNNNNQEGIDVLGSHPAHAIGINKKVADHLSGADFDGDTVLVIPTKGQQIRADHPLAQLKDFDPKELYKKSDDMIHTGADIGKPGEPGYKKGDGFVKGAQMGSVSNLITDMTIKNADMDEIARAVKHSMVVIDAEKHNLDWKQSEIDNRIPELKEMYQGGKNRGASTLISKASGQDSRPERKELNAAYKMTAEQLEDWNAGKKVYEETNRTYVDPKTGKVKKALTEGTKMGFAEDAHELSSGYPIEEVYANHANRLKFMANEARKIYRSTDDAKWDRNAAKVYDAEVKSLEDKLNTAALNAPRERQAQLIANYNIASKIQADPSLRDGSKDSKERLKKLRSKELAKARDATDARRYRIPLTQREWEAIQAGAISSNKFKQILRYADPKDVKELSSSRKDTGMKAATKARARALLNSGYPQSYVAEQLGVSTATLAKEFKNFNEIGGD